MEDYNFSDEEIMRFVERNKGLKEKRKIWSSRWREKNKEKMKEINKRCREKEKRMVEYCRVKGLIEK